MYYSKKELRSLGFNTVGENTEVSKLCSLYLNGKSSIGNYVRIDDFTVIKGCIDIGDNIHIGSFCSFNASGSKITLEDYVGISTHCGFFTAIEDFINPTLMSPAINKEFSKISKREEIILESASKVGSNCTFLPGSKVGYGASIGANSVISSEIREGSIIAQRYRGIKVFGVRDITEIRNLQKMYENKD